MKAFCVLVFVVGFCMGAAVGAFIEHKEATQLPSTTQAMEQSKTTAPNNVLERVKGNNKHYDIRVVRLHDGTRCAQTIDGIDCDWNQWKKE